MATWDPYGPHPSHATFARAIKPAYAVMVGPTAIGMEDGGISVGAARCGRSHVQLILRPRRMQIVELDPGQVADASGLLLPEERRLVPPGERRGLDGLRGAVDSDSSRARLRSGSHLSAAKGE